MLSTDSVLDKDALGIYVLLAASLDYALDETILVSDPNAGAKLAWRAERPPAFMALDRCTDGLFRAFDALENLDQGCPGYAVILRFAG